MEEEKALETIEEIQFKAVRPTNYEKALNKKAPNPMLSGDDWFGVIALGLLMGNAGISALIGHSIFGSWIFFMICFLTIFTSGLTTLLLKNSKHNKKNIEETLDDPDKKFEWHLQRAIEVFNKRASAWNHLLGGYKHGFIEEDEGKMQEIYASLSKSKKMLERACWLRTSSDEHGFSTEPQLAIFLQELSDAEKELGSHFASLEDKSLPAKEL